MSIPAILFIIHTIICWTKGWKPLESAFYTIHSFVITIAWLSLVCGILINLLEFVQVLTNINAVFLGMTCLAWANSIGDYRSITTFAKQGLVSTAIAGIFSGQLFNFFVGFGSSLMVQSSREAFEFNIFSLEGLPFDIISSLIALHVIMASLGYLCFVFYKVLKNK